MTNQEYAHYLIDQLIQQGTIEFCIAPGSRSTPLALAAARHPKTHVTVHTDERGLGFYALGLSIANQTPTVIIVTSGTAVGNLLPCVMEAYHSHVPLIILSADRPPELQSCGANQTTDQIKIFQNFVLWQADLPCSDNHISDVYLRSQAAFAFFQAMRKGPVHLNCQFREPLFELPQPQNEGTKQFFFSPMLSPAPDAIAQCEAMISKANRGLILLGRLPIRTPLTPILQMAKNLGWPIFADLLSQARAIKDSRLIDTFEDLIQSKKTPSPDFVIHLGEGFISTRLLEWIHLLNVPMIHVSQEVQRQDPLHNRPMRIWADPIKFCQQIMGHSKDLDWLERWQRLDQRMKEKIEASFAEPHPWTEVDTMRVLGQKIPSNWSLFIANSMSIRNAQRFLFPGHAQYFFANRGLAGIDGQIATAAGIAAGLKQPLAAIIGDQSCLHDLNSLPLIRSLNTPFLLIISNNFGGGIFSHLNVAIDDQFDRLFAAEHDYRFEKAAEMFHLPYRCINNNDLEPLFESAGPLIVEIITSRKENAIFENQILEKTNCTATY